MTTVTAGGHDPEWTPMLKRTLLILTVIATGGGIIAAIVSGIFVIATWLSNIDHSVQELTKSGESRDKAVSAVAKSIDDPDTGIKKTLANHWEIIQATKTSVDTGLSNLQKQISDFEFKTTGTPSAPRHDPHH